VNFGGLSAGGESNVSKNIRVKQYGHSPEYPEARRETRGDAEV